ncbi:MAG: methyltransferase regulatory domain-containing protein, partial [Limisphaerales bacterium]
MDAVISARAMHEPPVSDYDKFAYPSGVHPQTHPDRLAVIATLMGLPAARIEQARVLELGCGDGNNLITMACTLPNSRFYGVDLAIEPIRRGQEAIAALGLKNVVLRQMNILEAPADLGTFDYIIAHGLYSWVPGAVREKILAICREHLAEDGVAYISYNAYPGCHLRDLTRHMMLFHVRQFSEPREKISQARALLKFLAEANPHSGLWHEVLGHELERIQKYLDAGFFHDDLSPLYQPFYFHEFVEAAARHQLEFLSEADVKDMQPSGLTEEGVRVLHTLEQRNRVAHEQYTDFVVGRAFRQTLLCRQGRPHNRELKSESVANLFVAADATQVNSSADPAAPGMEDFQRG